MNKNKANKSFDWEHFASELGLTLGSSRDEEEVW